jgi:hypothetical protein
VLKLGAGNKVGDRSFVRPFVRMRVGRGRYVGLGSLWHFPRSFAPWIEVWTIHSSVNSAVWFLNRGGPGSVSDRGQVLSIKLGTGRVAHGRLIHDILC